jgi:signal transduction histidine kinase
VGTLVTVLDTNRQLIQFLYGQAFFIAALAIALRANRDSNFRLARCIWLFALFAVLHAFSEWGEVFIPLQRTYLPDAFVRGLQAAQILLVGASFIVLYEFGAFLLACLRPTLGWLRLLTLPLGAAWITSFVFGSSLLSNFAGNFVDLATALARILLLMPATVLAVTALSIEAADAELVSFPRISSWLRWAAAGLLAWALVAETATSTLQVFGGSGLSYLEAPLVTAAIPAGLCLAYCITRAMEIFSSEQRRQMDAMERRHLLLLERERIGQELHDGVTQILYSIGLHSQAGALRSDDPGTCDLLESISGLARTGLDEIRSAIDASLPRLKEGHTLEKSIEALPAEYAPAHGPTIEVNQLGAVRSLAPGVEATLYRIAREAFLNACRHGGASHVAVELEFQDDRVEIRIQDNGVGITEGQRVAALQREGTHLGLAGLVQRLAPWHGSLGVRRRPQGGTEVTGTIPLSPCAAPPLIADGQVRTAGGVP